jgi:transposase-like protein
LKIRKIKKKHKTLKYVCDFKYPSDRRSKIQSQLEAHLIIYIKRIILLNKRIRRLIYLVKHLQYEILVKKMKIDCQNLMGKASIIYSLNY